MEDLENNVIIQDQYICKSISGEEDENGNYKFEVEASNENLDLQNQITLQSALKKSEEYFVTNGVISDDHLHKTRNPDGSVETHKDKIIGEPISVRFDPSTKKTFVKGILYSGIEAAKPYIDLLKNKSRLVKASIGGIMPKIRKNADGSETVTSFMWNDLALTCSPVNWTVGSAKFAKSIGAIDFCKSLNAGSGTDSAEFDGGRTLQNEDLEDETVKLQKMTKHGKMITDDEDEDLEKSDDLSIIKSCIIALDTGEVRNQKEAEKYLINKGIDMYKARDLSLEIINQGGIEMKKSHFSSTINELLKSFGGEEPEDDKKKKKDSDEDAENTLFDDDENDDMETDDSDEEVTKGCMKKSFDEEGEYLDATELMKSMGETIDSQREEIESLKKSLEEVQENMIEVTKSFGDYIKTPNARTTIMQKSVGSNVASNGPAKLPTAADFDILKSALVNATKKGTIGLEEVQFYNAEFQKSMKGQKINPKTWEKICSIVKENR